jgi:hypothetical protein
MRFRNIRKATAVLTAIAAMSTAMAVMAPPASAAVGSKSIGWKPVSGGSTAAIVTIEYNTTSSGYYVLTDLRVGNPNSSSGTVYAYASAYAKSGTTYTSYSGGIGTGQIWHATIPDVQVYNTTYSTVEIDTPYTSTSCVWIKPSNAFILAGACET